MRGFSKAIIAGNLTRDPEMRATASGTQVASFGVAVNRSFKGADGTMQEQVSFLDCTAWGRTGETIAQYLKKGSPILLSGRIDQHSWDDKASGQKRSRVEITVEDFTFIGGGNETFDGGGSGAAAGSSSRSRSSSKASKPAADFVPEDLPDDEAINLDDIPF